MPLPSPNLDDRTFEQLVAEARQRILANAPGWTDLSVGDPGMALVDVFAYLADTTIFRLNQVPAKLYVEFLRLIGVQIQPPSAATTTLEFTREADDVGRSLELPRGTRVTVASGAGTEAPVFETVEIATLVPGSISVSIRAVNAELIEGEDLGISTGQAGQSFTVRRPPIIADTGDPLDLVVGVEVVEGDPIGSEREIEFEGKPYRVWREVDSFTDLGSDREAYIADRAAGTILLAGAARVATGDESSATLTDELRPLADVPRLGRHMRAWYRHGGGLTGNVAAGTLTVMKEPIKGISATNPDAATGGRAVETLENALTRGPQQLYSLNRAVTARDFQLVAERSPGIARGRAFTQAALWQYATPGTVELVVVPSLPDPALAAGVTAEQLVLLQTAEAIEQTQRAVELRRPLGTRCEVGWARYKTVRVRATIAVQREEDVAAVRQRVDERLHLTINPLPTSFSTGGWPFGQGLYGSEVYRIVLAEAGVRYARDVRLLVDEVPGTSVEAIEADLFQAHTWYAGSGSTVFRTLNDGEGWEPMGRFGEELAQVIRVHPERPGLLAVAASPPAATGEGSSVHVSFDSGETWPFTRRYGFRVEDLAWLVGNDEPVLLMATGPSVGSTDGKGGGLYRLGVSRENDLAQLVVDPTDQDLAFYAVATVQEVRGDVTVVCAAQGRQVTGGQRRWGAYLSNDAGQTGTYREIGMEKEDVRVLKVQRDGPRNWLWAGTAAPGGATEPGHGCFRRELLGREDPVGGWDQYANGWTAGSIHDLAFAGSIVTAATQQVGVMRLDSSLANPVWFEPTVDSGLPPRDLQGNLMPVRSIAIDPGATMIMAGGPVGVRRTNDEGDAPTEPPRKGSEPKYESCSESEFSEEVTLPPTWLFVCGQNELTVTADATT
jgi:hypothetical protein